MRDRVGPATTKIAGTLETMRLGTFTLLASALLAAGCGGSDEETDPTGTVTIQDGPTYTFSIDECFIDNGPKDSEQSDYRIHGTGDDSLELDMGQVGIGVGSPTALSATISGGDVTYIAVGEGDVMVSVDDDGLTGTLVFSTGSGNVEATVDVSC